VGFKVVLALAVLMLVGLVVVDRAAQLASWTVLRLPMSS
jgi:hypothetical protein